LGCKAIARRLWKTNYGSIRKVIRDRQLPRSNSKRAANREFENGRQNVLLDHEKKRRETIKRIDENHKVIRRLKKKCQTIMEAQINCPYKIDWRNQSWQSVVYWANLEKERARSRESAKSRVIVKGSHLHIKKTCSNMLWRAIKLGHIKKRKTMYYFGCSVEQLKAHLQSKFQPGMTWGNHGPAWEVDHIVPCDSFDLTDDYQVRLCNHYTNLQPLWADENLKKSNFWTTLLFYGILKDRFKNIDIASAESEYTLGLLIYKSKKVNRIVELNILPNGVNIDLISNYLNKIRLVKIIKMFYTSVMTSKPL
jgi:hypothetical protein